MHAGPTFAAWPSACGTSSFTSGDAPDGSTSLDAANDTSDATTADVFSPDGATANFCASRNTVLLCADFDEPDDLRNAFVNGGEFAFFALPTVSPALGDAGSFARQDGGDSLPFSLATTFPSLMDAGSELQAQTQGMLMNVAANHFKLETDLQFLQVGDFPSDFTLSLLALVLTDDFASNVTKYDLGARQNHVWLDVGNATTTLGSLDLGSLPSASPVWRHLVVDITLGIGGRLAVSLGGVDASGPAAAGTMQTHAKVELVPSSFGYTGEISLGYDNVVLVADDAGLPDGGVAGDD